MYIKEIANPPFCEYPISLSFDGKSSFVELGNDSSLNISGLITIQAWIMPTAQDGIRNIVAHGYNENPKEEVYLRIIDGKYQIGSWNGPNHLVEFPIPPIDLNKWVYLCGVYDGTGWSLYRNGSLVAHNPDSTGALPSNANWAIGARGDGSSRFFQGLIRDVALWKCARNATEIALDMYTFPSDREEFLVGYWALDEGEGDEAYDYSEFNKNGIIHNATWYAPKSNPTNTLVCPGHPLNGYVELGNPAKLNFAGQITIMAWIMLHKTDGIQNIIAHGYTDNPKIAEVYFRIHSGEYQIGSWNGTDYRAEMNIPQCDLMKWVHLAGVYDGINWLLYRNGKLEASNPSTIGAIEVDADWAIGARGDGTSRYLSSCVKEVSIWSTALSANAIADTIQNGIQGTEQGLRAYWPLDEGAGPEVFDALIEEPCDGFLRKAGWAVMPDLPKIIP